MHVKCTKYTCYMYEIYMYVYFQLKINAGNSNRSLFLFSTLTNLLFDRSISNEKWHFHWKIETCRFDPENEHLTSCKKYHQSILTMPWDVMLPVRSALKTQIPERFISLSFKATSVGNMSNPSCPDHVPEIPQWLEYIPEPARYAWRMVGTFKFSASGVGRCRGAASAYLFWGGP